MARKMLPCPVLALPAKEVWDHQHEAQLGHRIILVYNMCSVDIELLMSVKKMQWTF